MGFDVWPRDSDPEANYGPDPPQDQVFKIPHKHDLDIVLYIGGSSSGKTVTAVARVLSQVLTHPGSEAIVAAYDRDKLQKSALKEWEARLSVGTGSWNHDFVLQRPSQYNKFQLKLKAKNPLTGEVGTSIIWFCYLKNWQAIMGITADIAHYEEAQMIQNENAYYEAIRRMRGHGLKRKQIILTTNPEETFGWIYNTFSLKQLEPTYSGPKIPIGKPCNCQFCQDCLNKHRGEFLYPTTNEGAICPGCGDKKEDSCPGNQEWMRVIVGKSSDNTHVKKSFVQNIIGSMSDDLGKIYTEGAIISVRTGKVYKPFSKKDNVLPDDVAVDFSKDLIWSFDWNLKPQCSVIAQVEDESKVIIKDELVLWGAYPGDYGGATPEDVALEFIKRYKGFKEYVLIYGDPSSFSGGTYRRKTNFQIIYTMLTEAGFKVKLMMQKKKGEIRIAVHERVDCVNKMLRNEHGLVRLFFNPCVHHTIESMEKNIWTDAKKGKEDIDDHCDRNAIAAMNKNVVFHLTHPGDALGYFIWKAYNLILKKESNILYIPNVSISTQEDRGEIVREDLKPKDKKDPRKPTDLRGMLGLKGHQLNNNLQERLDYERERL